MVRRTCGLAPPPGGPRFRAWGFPEGPAALRREIQQVSAEAGRVVARFTRLMFVLISSLAWGERTVPPE
jgi:hypothetical protein